MICMNTQRELMVAIDAARTAGRAIMDVYKSGDFGVVLKGDESPVGRADRESNLILANALTLNFPVYGLITEEDVSGMGYSDDALRAIEEASSLRFKWVVDPLDGTKNFIDKNGRFVVHVALLDENRPVLGVNYLPVSDEMLYASDFLGYSGVQIGGDGTWEKLHVSGISELALGRVLLGSDRNYSTRMKEAINKEFFGEPEMAGPVMGYQMSKVAQGYASLYFIEKPSFRLWDIASSEPIVRLAGGKMTYLDGENFDFSALVDFRPRDGFLVSNRKLHEAALEDIAQLRG